jgi:hypothetical protein
MPKKSVEEEHPPYYVADVGEKPTVEELKEIEEPVVKKPQGTEFEPINCSKCGTELVDAPNIGLHCPNHECGVIQEPKIEDVPSLVAVQATPEVESEYVYVNGQVYHRNAAPSGYVQNEEQKVSNKWTNTITSEEYLKTSKDKKV